jgi:hypothetical protein
VAIVVSLGTTGKQFASCPNKFEFIFDIPEYRRISFIHKFNIRDHTTSGCADEGSGFARNHQ